MESPRHAQEPSAHAAPKAAHAVRNPRRLDAEIRTWCFATGRRPEPTVSPLVSTTWWDTIDERLSSRALQLVQRRDGEGHTELELVAPDRRRRLEPHTIGQWLLRGRALVALLRVTSSRRSWTNGSSHGLEWVDWHGPGGARHAMVGVVGEDPAAQEFLDSPGVRALLGGSSTPPTWSDHALCAVLAWIDTPTPQDATPRLVAAARLQRVLLREESPLLPATTEHLSGLVAREDFSQPIAGAPAHRVWRRGLRDAVRSRPQARELLLDRLASALRPRTLAEMQEQPLRLRGVANALWAARPWIDAPVRKTLRAFEDHLEILEERQQLQATDAILMSLLRSERIPPEAALEAGGLLRRNEREDAELHERLRALGPPRLRSRLRRWARGRRNASPRPGAP